MSFVSFKVLLVSSQLVLSHTSFSRWLTFGMTIWLRTTSRPNCAGLYGCRVVSYTHYPTISLDMLARVKSRSSLYNNNEAIARSGILSAVKVQYYSVLACFYGLAGARAHVSGSNCFLLKRYGSSVLLPDFVLSFVFFLSCLKNGRVQVRFRSLSRQGEGVG